MSRKQWFTASKMIEVVEIDKDGNQTKVFKREDAPIVETLPLVEIPIIETKPTTI